MSEPTYRILQPKQRLSPLVFASPHSGRAYPQDMLERSVLDAHSIRSSEDAYVDRLFDAAPEFGAPLLLAQVPRAYVDFNRSAEELDPALIHGVRIPRPNPRVTSGLGVIPRVVAGAQAIYRGKLSWPQAHRRLETHWYPYHGALNTLLKQNLIDFGTAILIDCHSMPREALDGVVSNGKTRPEIVIGDRFGMAAHGSIVDQIEAAFANVGFRVARNAPFAGAYISQTYGRPRQGQHAIQIEIDRSLYMDERTLVPHKNFNATRHALRQVISDITDIELDQRPLAAQ